MNPAVAEWVSKAEGDFATAGPELLDRLKKLMGEEGWRVEEITFQ